MGQVSSLSSSSLPNIGRRKASRTAQDLPADASVDSLLHEQRESWMRGERLTVEDLLAKRPDLAHDDDATLDLIYGEMLLREAAGEASSRSEYDRRFPRLVEALAIQFEVHDGIAQLQSQQPVSPLPSATRHRFDDYEVIEEIGRGGAGVVYKAQDRVLGRIVALKMLLAGSFAGAAELLRFRREAELAARLQHPQIVQVYDFGERDGCPYIALEFVEGGSLAEQLDGLPRAPREAAGFVAALADTVDFAHQRGVVHRDLKPANILLRSSDPIETSRGAAGRPALPAGDDAKITDFGLATRLNGDGSNTQSGTLIGTPGYMAPEQAAGHVRQIGPQSDVYALGAILYELLTGRVPFVGVAFVEVIEQVRFHEPVSPRSLQPRLSRDLDTICLKCLQKEPARRYATAAALADDLKRFLEGRPILARRVGPIARIWRWSRRKPAVASLGAALVLAVVIGFSAVFAFWQRSERLREHTAQAQARSERSFQKAHAFTRSLRKTLQHGELRDARQFDALRRSLTEAIAMYHQGVTHERGDDLPLLHELADVWEELAEERTTSQRVAEAFEAYYKSLALRFGLASRSAARADEWLPIARVYEEMGRVRAASQSHTSEAQAYFERARRIRTAVKIGNKNTLETASGQPPTVARSAAPSPSDDRVLTNSMGMALRWMPAGQFRMGSPPTELERSGDEQSADGRFDVRFFHEFAIGVTEVTQSQYLAVVHHNPAFFHWYDTSYPLGPAVDPKGPPRGLAPVVRGGHWLGTARFCRSAYRVDYDANDRTNYLGFRVVMTRAQVPPRSHRVKP